AYRLSFLEAGHICQNLQIVSSLLDVSSVPLGGFYDEDIRSMLDLEQEYCLYALAMG
ncbi:nitroreductase family protein, partial [Enterococcus faecalis]